VRPTVVIVDDHADFRRAARALLEAEGFAVVGEAETGRSAIAEVERLRPAVVLLDIQLPDLDGFAVAEVLNAGDDPPAIVLVSSREPEAYGGRVMSSTARGFLSKREITGAAVSALVG